jgi:1-acyl-sn-glycerol-3-phosphate acyltransferase
MLFFLYTYTIVLREFILSKFNLIYENQKIWGRDVFRAAQFFNGWRQYVKIDDNLMSSMKKDKILMMANHVNLTDIFQVQQMINTHFPEHKMVYLVKNSVTQLPIFGTYLRNHHIVVGNDHHQNIHAIKNYMERLKDEKILIFIFPEGGTYYKGNIQRSDKWCHQENIQPYNACMCPRVRGLFTLFEAYKFDTIIQTYLTYPDDIRRQKAVYYSDMFIGKLPRICNIFLTDVTDVFTKASTDFHPFSQLVYSYWREVDTFLTEIYSNYEREYHEVVSKAFIYHDIFIPHSMITWNTAKLMFYSIPMAYMLYGGIYVFGLYFLIFTSYQYHCHHKYVYLDILTSLIMYIYTYTYSMNKTIILYAGLCFIGNQLLQTILPLRNAPISYHFHSMVHILGFVHLIVECLYKYGM